MAISRARISGDSGGGVGIVSGQSVRRPLEPSTRSTNVAAHASRFVMLSVMPKILFADEMIDVACTSRQHRDGRDSDGGDDTGGGLTARAALALALLAGAPARRLLLLLLTSHWDVGVGAWAAEGALTTVLRAIHGETSTVGMRTPRRS